VIVLGSGVQDVSIQVGVQLGGVPTWPAGQVGSAAAAGHETVIDIVLPLTPNPFVQYISLVKGLVVIGPTLTVERGAIPTLPETPLMKH
jgi:hypothetical protein